MAVGQRIYCVNTEINFTAYMHWVFKEFSETLSEGGELYIE